MSVVLDIHNKTFANGTQALGQLQLQVQDGEFVAIVAPSGAGKTTLLRMIAGLDTEYSGMIQLPSTSSAHAETAFLFQEPRLMPWLSVIDNIRLVIPKAQRERYEPRIELLLKQVGLSQFAKAYPKELSGGMARRVALVRAFVREPRLLLMDEPFQALDAPTANQLRQMVLALWQSTRCTVMLVTHSLREALMLADRVVFLSSRPSQLVLDYPVHLPRPRALESTEIHQLHQSLLTQYPDLLSGSINEVEPC